MFLSYNLWPCARLYQYIHGANLNSSKLAFTSPVLTRIPSPSSQDGYTVRIYVSPHFQGKPPLPNPELKLQVEKWKTQCLAVLKFSGYAKDSDISREFEALASSLNKNFNRSSGTIQDASSYTIAQYNAPIRNSGRLNEVWLKVSGLENCWGLCASSAVSYLCWSVLI